MSARLVPGCFVRRPEAGGIDRFFLPGVCLRRLSRPVWFAGRSLHAEQTKRGGLRNDVRRSLHAVFRAFHDFWRNDAGDDATRPASGRFFRRAANAKANDVAQRRLLTFGWIILPGFLVGDVGFRRTHVARPPLTDVFERGANAPRVGSLRRSPGPLRPASLSARGEETAFASQAHYSFETLIDVSLCCRPGRNADAHGRFSLPHRSPAPASPAFLNAANDFSCYLRSSERDQHLIDGHVIQHLETGVPQTLGKSLCVGASSFH